MPSKTREFSVKRVSVRAVIPAILAFIFVWYFFDKLTTINITTLRLSMEAFPITTWATALICTWISFAAISRYDPLICGKLGLDVPPRRARSMGWKATAISQLVGFGLLTGTLMRWLELGFNPNKGARKIAPQALLITCAVGISFLLGWGSVMAMVTTVVQLGMTVSLLSIAAISACLVAFLVSSTKNRILNFIKDNLHLALSLSALAFVDTLFAAIVIYLFLPSDLAPFLTIYHAFLLAYAVGLVSGLTGGVGPFEICMIAFLPQIDIADLAPALLAFRIAYFAVPATCAVFLLAIQAPWRKISRTPFLVTKDIPKVLRGTAPAEVDLLTNGELECLSTNEASEAVLIYQTPSCIVQLGNTFGTSRRGDEALRALARNARWSRRSLSIYRCDKLTAMRARKIGLRHVRFSSEAIIQTSQFTLATPERASLRRKIRKAGRAGVSINSQNHALADLSQIDRDWTDHRGTARGFSTGRFSVDHISKQRIYSAYVDGKAVAFITFGASQKQWLLDLIRYNDDCPSGTIYALVAQAIEDARLHGIETVSLGCVPFAPTSDCLNHSDRLKKLIFERNSTLQGLYQFKKSFDPIWQDRFFATQSISSFFRCGIAIFCTMFDREPSRRHVQNS